MLKVRSLLSAIRVQFRDRKLPPLSADPLPELTPDTARGVVVSFYMPNISRAVVAAQRKVLKKFVPRNVAIQQICTLKSHEDALNNFMRTTPYRTVLVLDIDCIPIREGAVDAVFSRAERGALVGAAQRANHIDNNAHIYAAPYCLALTKATYRQLGEPRFDSTPRGDVAEELTYAAEQYNIPLELLWPLASDDDVWELTQGKRYGHATTYEEGFWHAFQIRFPEHQRAFVERCDQFLRASST